MKMAFDTEMIGLRANEPDASTVSTMLVYPGLQTAYDFMNDELFDGALPDVFLVFSRRARSGGHYAAHRYSGRDNNLDRAELSQNPDHFIGRDDKWIVSILVHEQCHHWQEVYGTPPKRAYHNKQFAYEMEARGLLTTSTGAVGGRRTGARMGHLIIPGGAYELAFNKLEASGWRLALESRIVSGGGKAPQSKEKFTCSSCDANAWGKPTSELVCKACLLDSLTDLSLSKAKAAQLIELIDCKTMQPPKPEGSAS